MSRSIFVALLVGTTAIAACSESPGPQASAPPVPGDDGSPGGPDTPGPDPDPAPGPTPDPPWQWVPPVVPTTSPACGTAQPAAVGASYATASGRSFHVWGPPQYDPNVRYPVVVAYHGWYADGKGHQSWFEMEKSVNGEAFVVYPDSDGPTWDTSGTKDLAFFDDMIKQLGETYCINPARVLAFGFSYGGRFVSHLACKRAGWVKAAAIGAAGYGGDGQKCGRVPVLFSHRTSDPDELIAWGRTAEQNWTTINGCSADTDVSDAAMNCATHRSCSAPGSVTFCEDTHVFEPPAPANWNHTVRDIYRAYTFQWFKALP
ncbi:MAG: hypothetical protein KF819_28285 [Labilithrix sp.]|nr:hypothetical protein [Labilithrix sp.]